jgi:hypothetical protein
MRWVQTAVARCHLGSFAGSGGGQFLSRTKGWVSETFAALRSSPKTGTAKAIFDIATDGAWVVAENTQSGEKISDHYANLGQQFGFFLPLAGV